MLIYDAAHTTDMMLRTIGLINMYCRYAAPLLPIHAGDYAMLYYAATLIRQARHTVDAADYGITYRRAIFGAPPLLRHFRCYYHQLRHLSSRAPGFLYAAFTPIITPRGCHTPFSERAVHAWLYVILPLIMLTCWLIERCLCHATLEDSIYATTAMPLLPPLRAAMRRLHLYAMRARCYAAIFIRYS